MLLLNTCLSVKEIPTYAPCKGRSTVSCVILLNTDHSDYSDMLALSQISRISIHLFINTECGGHQSVSGNSLIAKSQRNQNFIQEYWHS